MGCKTSTKLWQNSKRHPASNTCFIKTKSHILIPQLCCLSLDFKSLSYWLPLFWCFICLCDTKVMALLLMKTSPKGCWVRDKNQMLCLQAVRKFVHGFIMWRFLLEILCCFPHHNPSCCSDVWSKCLLCEMCVRRIVAHACALPRQMCFIRERPRILS